MALNKSGASKMSELTGRPLTRAWLARVVYGQIGPVFNFQYNPTQITTEYGVNYSFSSPAGSPLPTAHFSSVSGDLISFTLLLDATEDFNISKKGVGAQKAELLSLAHPDLARYEQSIGQYISPPQVLFGIGSLMQDVVVVKLIARDVRFNRQLMVTRCNVDMQLRAIFTSPEAYAYRLSKLSRLRSIVTTGRSSPTLGITESPYIVAGEF